MVWLNGGVSMPEDGGTKQRLQAHDALSLLACIGCVHLIAFHVCIYIFYLSVYMPYFEIYLAILLRYASTPVLPPWFAKFDHEAMEQWIGGREIHTGNPGFLPSNTKSPGKCPPSLLINPSYYYCRCCFFSLSLYLSPLMDSFLLRPLQLVHDCKTDLRLMFQLMFPWEWSIKE